MTGRKPQQHEPPDCYAVIIAPVIVIGTPWPLYTACCLGFCLGFCPPVPIPQQDKYYVGKQGIKELKAFLEVSDRLCYQ